MRFITPLDYWLLPIYGALIVFLFVRYNKAHYPPGHPWRPYFLPALYLKLFGAVFIGLVYQYYYGYGDTAAYFNNARLLNRVLSDSPLKWFRILTGQAAWFESGYYTYISQFSWYAGGGYSNFIVASFAAVIGLFTFGLYLPTALVFAALSFTGVWALFRAFAKLYPSAVSHLALGILFIPSMAIWGSGIFKDTVCICCIGWLTYIFFEIWVHKRYSASLIIGMLACFWLIKTIKIYIIVAYLPAILIWIFINASGRIAKRTQRVVLRLTLYTAAIGLTLWGLQSFNEQLGAYSIENIAKTSGDLRQNLYNVSAEEGSAYSLGEVSPSLGGALLKAPAAINVTLFRPYPWEARKAIIFLNAIESFALLLLTIWLLFRDGPKRIYNNIANDSTIRFCLIYTAIFAFAVGISTSNFGTLSRYKIPCTPFFCVALVLLYHRAHLVSKRNQS